MIINANVAYKTGKNTFEVQFILFREESQMASYSEVNGSIHFLCVFCPSNAYVISATIEPTLSSHYKRSYVAPGCTRHEVIC
jgi:hypothetical protein